MSFKAVSSQIDFPTLERELLDYWHKEGIVEKYLHRNDDSDQKFSFLDGPITANNPMGVHHAWGRTYKDVWQRWYNMRGYKQRFQNGFDEQGLWVEVEVEKELELHSKKDILELVPGDEFASLEKFVNLCKDRVKKFSDVQTNQSKRLGYFMDWDNSYHTSSPKNNFEIWHFLKTVSDKGWLYKGHDSVPWCPRCGTAISQHEILTEDYKELTHESIYFKLPLIERNNEYLLVWTTTPWTIPANVAVAVNEEEEYIKYPIDEGHVWVMAKALTRLIEMGILEGGKKQVEILPGKEMDGWKYEAPFDGLDRVKKSMGDSAHVVVLGDQLILPVGSDEGTGLVHIAPGAGTEDFQLGKKLELPVIEVIDEGANYLSGFGEFSEKNAKKHPELIIDYLREHEGGKFLLTTQNYKHRYPACWRCKTELVWRVVDEWYISVDKQSLPLGDGKTDDSSKTYREQMKEVIKDINWNPKWGYERELDWLNHLHDWLISKKRFWGLALPIWECKKCGNFEVIGGEDELKSKAVEGWEKFEGHTPHRPWIDQVKIKCSKCEEIISRIPDVGNPWLDAGIVPFSTMSEEWFPAEFVTESFPGQFKNWFYSLIAMSTALKRQAPVKNLLGFASLVDEKGEAMHKSAGNSIEFNEAADKAGVDVMRWLYVTSNPETDVRFGFNLIDEIRRRFYLILWNSYKFFVDYASIYNWSCELPGANGNKENLTVLDRWILARFTEVVLLANKSLEKYDAATASRAIEDFVVNDFSTWYIRRSRDRVSVEAGENDRNVSLSVMYGILVGLSKILAPFMPFISEEMYRNLTEDVSVHLTDYPKGDVSLLDKELIENMKLVRQIVEIGHAKRKEAEIKLRQPLGAVKYSGKKLVEDLEKIIGEELNVKKVKFDDSEKEFNVKLDTDLSEDLKEEGKSRDFIRQIQQARKANGLTLSDKSIVYAPEWPIKFEPQILAGTASLSIVKADEFKVMKVDRSGKPVKE